MSGPRISVIIPTHNRPEKLEETLGHLTRQNLAASDYEIIVVDDGSTPPVTLSSRDPVATARGTVPTFRLVRLDGGERSAARNTGASIANGELLVFMDDDITVRDDFLTAHLEAHREWPQALLVGSIRLPESSLETPFGRFRQRLEDSDIPHRRGPTAMRNFCAAANMAISHARFEELGGFDRAISSGEDQDLALRHTGSGGVIAFVPDARVIHRDGALDVGSYCRRVEWGAEMIIPLCRRYPELPDNVERERVNGPVRWGAEPIALSARKVAKAAAGSTPLDLALMKTAMILERLAPESGLLRRLYRLLLGIYLQRGYRRGREREAIGGRSSSNLVPEGDKFNSRGHRPR